MASFCLKVSNGFQPALPLDAKAPAQLVSNSRPLGQSFDGTTREVNFSPCCKEMTEKLVTAYARRLAKGRHEPVHPLAGRTRFGDRLLIGRIEPSPGFSFVACHSFLPVFSSFFFGTRPKTLGHCFARLNSRGSYFRRLFFSFLFVESHSIG